MKIFSTIAKIVTALAAVIGAIYVVANYGDKIVDWAKGVYAKLSACCCDCCCEKCNEKFFHNIKSFILSCLIT